MIHILNKENTILNKFISQIRDKSIQKDSMRFRRNIERIGEVMGYEISKTLNYKTHIIETPLGEAPVEMISDQIVVATILRAGLPLHQGFLNYYDDAQNAFVSAYRKSSKDGKFTVKVEYISCCSLEGKTMLLVDPMLATGTSLNKPVMYICNVDDASAVSGNNRIDDVTLSTGNGGTEVNLETGAVDAELTSRAYIVPGIGDAGDLAFGEKLG